jgi:hypothetical protein
VIVVSKAGYGDEVTTRTFEEGSEVDLVLKLSPPVQAASRAAPSPGAEAERTRIRRPSRVPLYVALGVGAAGLATGAVAGGIAVAQMSKLRDTCPNHACSGSGSTNLARADTAADVATVGFIVGGVGGATAAVIWLLSPKEAGGSGDGSASSSASGSSRAGLRGGLGGVRVTPWIAPSGGGVCGAF